MTCSLRTFCLVLANVVLNWPLLAAAAERPPRPEIYRCQQHSVTVFSDRPCEAGAQPYEMQSDRTTLYEAPASQSPPATASKTQRRVTGGRQGRAEGAESRKNQLAKCQKLASSLREIRQKMRSGYGVEEGERLKQRQRKLTEQRRSQRCPS